MKIITVAALKGGVGKTNFCFNLATILALKEHKVLIIDFDPQGNLSRSFKLLKPKSIAKELFSQTIQLPNQEIVMNWKHKNIALDVIPTLIAMSTLEAELRDRTSVDTILQRTFRRNLNFFKKYDYILFDTSPSFNLINKNALLISDEIILISDNSVYSLDAINMLSNNWRLICDDLGIDNNINTIVLNNFDHYNVSKDFTDYIGNSKFKDKILKTQISRKQILKKAEMTGIPSVLNGKIENHIYHDIYKEREVI